ncbi:NEW3 domain-containing protein [Virgibacillus xinjiangensis]|uniref:NEW3 domain-containing protein n=1 Tax=Virgibacillus xinjiangensis TaxID=393090 RepID=A0ABV7CTQ5_9BACI
MKKALYVLLSALLVVSLIPVSITASDNEKHDVELWNAVKPLETTVTFLNTGAHPDDERSDLLAYLSRGLGVKTASLIANRGEGGQNEIGSELGNGLGVIRSNEMIEASEITGVKAYHLSETTSDAIYDFGFSKSPEETLDKWGEEVTYERLIRFIRTYQPDIVMPSFRNVDSQHGHHRAISVLSEKAFEDAADPTVFPEQLEEGLSVWQTKKFYLPADGDTATTTVEVSDGKPDPVYGMTYPQLGEESRYMHKSQGMGNDIPAEPKEYQLELVKSVVDGEEEQLFSGIPYDFNDWADLVQEKGLSKQLEKLQAELDHIIASYPDREAILPLSQQAQKTVKKLADKAEKAKLGEALENDLLHKLELKEEQLQEVSFISSSLTVETSIDSHVLTQGEETEVTMTVTNEGTTKIKHVEASLVTPESWQHEGVQSLKHLKPGETAAVSFSVTVPEDAAYYHPYEEAVVQAKVAFKEKGVITENISELDNTVSVLPELSVTTDPENLVINTADVQEEIPVAVQVKNYDEEAKNAVVSLNLPDGWESDPAEKEVTFSDRYEEQRVTFQVSPPQDLQAEELSLTAQAEADGEVYDTTVQEIKYDHINDAYLQYPATIDTVAFELLMPEGLKVGYIESGFDKVADYLANAGMDITKLSEEDLATGNLSQYDTIVTGIRAYLSREDLREHNDRLLEYTENGGHFVVQYNKPWDNWKTEGTAPYPLEIGQPSIEWRVTDEDAEVTMTQPDHALFNFPNKITDNDWDNWVQERGLYYPMNWDENYETFVSMADPGEEPFDGGILLTEYGEGTYMYSNLVFYRQIDNQVPGGYRIFTNMISYGAQ